MLLDVKWLAPLARVLRTRNDRTRAGAVSAPAFVEPLEERLLLSVSLEIDDPSRLTVTTADDVVNDGDGVLSLREAILIANDSSGLTSFDGVQGGGLEFNAIVFDDAVFNAGAVDTIILNGTQLPIITEDLLIEGGIDSFGNSIFIDGNDASRLLEVESGVSLELKNLGLVGGYAVGESGGAILNRGTLEINGSLLAFNAADVDGGAIWNASSGLLTLNDSAVSANYADVDGGGIFNDGGTVTLNGSTIGGVEETEGNLAGSDGGGIFNLDGVLSAVQSTIAWNSAIDGAGGGLSSLGETIVSLTDVGVSENWATGVGGGIDVYTDTEATITIESSFIGGNTGGWGGGIVVDGDVTLAITASLISGNRSFGNGGGIAAIDAAVTITDSLVGGMSEEEGNRTSGFGGGIYAFGGLLHISGTTIANNFAGSEGGGILLEAVETTADATIVNSTISGNATDFAGGGILVFDETITLRLENVTLVKNHAFDIGGGIMVYAGTVLARNSIVANNTVASGGTSPDIAGALQSDGFNLIGDPSGATLTGDTVNDLTGVDPQVGPLADNDGPTPTHALLPTSPARDAADDAVAPPTDQRGVVRPQGQASDIGAYELRTDASAVLVTAGPGGGPAVRILNAVTGEMSEVFFPFNPAFRGGLTVATADLNGDSYLETIVGVASGGPPHVLVYDGASGALLSNFFAFPEAFHGGLTLATGDIDGDGAPEIIAGARAGGGPAVAIFDGLTGTPVEGPFFAFPPSFRGGVNVATGDVNGDGVDEIIVGAGPGGGPVVRIYDFNTHLSGGVLVEQFLAFPVGFKGGVFVSAADLDEDGFAEIVAGAGAGGGPAVRIFESDGTQIGETIFAFATTFRGGVTVATGDVHGGSEIEIIVGAGPGGGPAVRTFDPDTGAQLGETLFAFPTAFRGGVFVAGPSWGLSGEGSPLRLDHSTPPAEPPPKITPDDLASIVSAAQTRLTAAGLPGDLLAPLAEVQFFVADLGGDLLGLSHDGRIYLDDDAGGYGWFVDYSPLLDEEFFGNGSTLAALESGAASSGIDLLSAVLHELGHALGLDHGTGLMRETLAAGVRRLPAPEDLDALFAQDELLAL